MGEKFIYSFSHFQQPKNNYLSNSWSLQIINECLMMKNRKLVTLPSRALFLNNHKSSLSQENFPIWFTNFLVGLEWISGEKKRATWRRWNNDGDIINSLKISYCWTLQASQVRMALLRFRFVFTAIFWASSIGKFSDSFLQIICSTDAICKLMHFRLYSSFNILKLVWEGN